MNDNPKLVAVPLVALGIVIGFAVAHFLFIHQLRSSERDVVRTKLEACRSAYVHAGVAGLRKYIAGESYFERESSFVEVIGADGHLGIFNAPQSEKEVAILKPLARPTNPAIKQEWLKIPAAEKRMDWTIGRTELPDGSVMFIGTMIDNHRLAFN
jgi:hypothetical protein